MKKIVLLLAFLRCAAEIGFSQGQVNFNNNGLLAGNPPSILVFNLDGSPLIGTNWVAQLYYSEPGSPVPSLIPVANEPAHFRQPTTTHPGTWSGGTRTLAGFDDGSQVVLQVRVWDGELFPNYETAFAAGGTTGKSVLFNYVIVPPGSCSVTCYLMVNFQGFTLVDPRPPLSMTLSRDQNQLVLSWPTNAVGFTLQSSPSFGPDATWTDCTNAVLAGNQYLMIATVSSTSQFYRLKR